MLSDKESRKTLAKKQPRRKINAPKEHWGDTQKLETVEAYIMLGGNAKQTSVALGVPHATIQRWRKTEWWRDAYEEVKQQDNIVLSLRLQKIVARSLDLVEDRLEKGDIFYDQKLGQIIRKEVSLRDAHQVFKDSFMVKEAIEKPASLLLDNESVADKLSILAAQFATLAASTKAKPAIEVTDVVFLEEKKDALHEEGPEDREEREGLQT